MGQPSVQRVDMANGCIFTYWTTPTSGTSGTAVELTRIKPQLSWGFKSEKYLYWTNWSLESVLIFSNWIFLILPLSQHTYKINGDCTPIEPVSGTAMFVGLVLAAHSTSRSYRAVWLGTTVRPRYGRRLLGGLSTRNETVFSVIIL